MKPVLRQDAIHVSLTILSTFSNAVLGLIGGVLLVTSLDKRQYGLISSCIAILLVAQELVGRGINDSLLRFGTDLVESSRDNSNEIFRAGFAIKLFVSVVIALFFIFFSNVLHWILGTSELVPAYPCIVISILGYGIWSFILARRQARFEFMKLALYQPMNNFLRVVMFLSLYYLGYLSWISAQWVIAGCFLLASLVLGYTDWIELLRLSWIRSRFWEAVRTVYYASRWNLFAATIYVAYSRMDIFILLRHMEKSDVAVYNASWQVLTIIDLFTTSIMTVMIPKVCHHRSKTEFLKWIQRSVLLSGASSLLLLPLFLLSDWYVPAILGAEYIQVVSLIKIMFFGNLVTLLIFPLIGILYAKKLFYVITCLHIFIFALSIPSYTYAIQHYGIMGSAWTTLFIKLSIALLISMAVAISVFFQNDPQTDDRWQSRMLSEGTQP